MEEEGVGATRQHEVEPRRLLIAGGGTVLLVGLLAVAIVVFTPLRTLIPGYGTEEIRRNARLNAIRVSALQDSVELQRRYIERLQRLMTGRVDSAAAGPGGSPPGEASSAAPGATRTGGEQESMARTDEGRSGGERIDPSMSSPATGPARSLSTLRPPVRPPVEGGFPTRRFNAQNGHYGIDIAVAEGTRVRSIGPGYVVLADWTQEGGHTIAVQHADGYLSVYKHNKQLLKETGDHVQAREALAVSGNTGEITTGPHVHFELWRNGLTQDPRAYVTGW